MYGLFAEFFLEIFYGFVPCAVTTVKGKIVGFNAIGVGNSLFQIFVLT